MSAGDVLLWVAYPYVCLTIFIAGHIWRYRFDKFGWTARSTQVYESRILRWASPLFHFGILTVGLGHVVGLLVPESFTSAIGVSEAMYHFGAITMGTVSGIATAAGLAMLIYRRRTVGAVFRATTVNDKVMYVFLGFAILSGLAATTLGNALGAGYDYRLTVSPWLRSLLLFQPVPQLAASLPIYFKVHVIATFSLFAVWPFTRLVHMLSAPIGYLTRPYIVYRSRDPQVGLRRTRRGWERVRL